MKIIYWSGTGNTEKMAELIAKGISESGKTADVINVSDANINTIKDEDVLILGCPAMGSEELEQDEFEPFIEEISSSIVGKKVALFGSYGWGDGEWMRSFKDRMIGYGCIISEECLIVQENPEDNENECIQFGKKIASL